LYESIQGGGKGKTVSEDPVKKKQPLAGGHKKNYMVRGKHSAKKVEPDRAQIGENTHEGKKGRASGKTRNPLPYSGKGGSLNLGGGIGLTLIGRQKKKVSARLPHDDRLGMGLGGGKNRKFRSEKKQSHGSITSRKGGRKREKGQCLTQETDRPKKGETLRERGKTGTNVRKKRKGNASGKSVG